MMENRAFDHLFGFYPGVDGLTGSEYNLVNTSDPSSEKVYVSKDASYVARCDTAHGYDATTHKVFGEAALRANNFSHANMDGFVEYEMKIHDQLSDCDVMRVFTPEKIPVLSFLAKEYCIMDRYFCSMPGPTWPNRMFTISGTSYGATNTGPWFMDKTGSLFPQKTIFDQVTDNGLSWKNYYNDTPWEIFMETIAHNPANSASLQEFFEDARLGNLPSFSWINPRSGINVTTGHGSNDMHPNHDVALSERFYKDIYEALRASPQWEELLFVITFDEHGGFYDHVSTPVRGVPPPDDHPSWPSKNFSFDRLGIRVPTLLISPWIKKSLVVSEPPAKQKPFPTSEYDGTSIIATTRKLLNMNSPPLTRRDAWSATFEHVLEDLTTPRTDCPLHTPEPPAPTRYDEAEYPLHDLQLDIIEVLSHLNDVPVPKHSKQGEVSDWVMKHYKKHHHKTHKWKTSKTALDQSVLCMPCLWGIKEKKAMVQWDINSDKTVAYQTISSRKFETDPLCLDSGSSMEGAQVKVSVCYPSTNPAKNRDLKQHWIAMGDATIRPYYNPVLCLTNYLEKGDKRLFLEYCDDRVSQKWAYHGKAPGNDGNGYFFFGDAGNCLSINTTNTLKH